jgi:hypothetical protein
MFTFNKTKGVILMTIKDSGNIKCTSMMFPKHVKYLNVTREEESVFSPFYKESRPLLQGKQ